MQKFIKGDIVKIAKKIDNKIISKERLNRYAIVIGSYADMLGCIVPGISNEKIFQLIYEDGEEFRWFNENDLILIERNNMELLEKALKNRKKLYKY